VSLLASDCARGKLRNFLNAMVMSGAARPRSAGVLQQRTRQRFGGGLREADAAALAVRSVMDARRAALAATHAAPD
jgi:hypothetical protein